MWCYDFEKSGDGQIDIFNEADQPNGLIKMQIKEEPET